MLYPAMSTLLKKIGNRYLLVNVVARRARELAEEAEEMEFPLEDKPVTLAIEEIAGGELTVVPKRHAQAEDPDAAREQEPEQESEPGPEAAQMPMEGASSEEGAPAEEAPEEAAPGDETPDFR